jgi:hypothetical protein
VGAIDGEKEEAKMSIEGWNEFFEYPHVFALN